VLYSAVVVDVGGRQIVLPPRGIFQSVLDKDGFQTVRYDSPTRPYPIAMTEEEFVYEEHATCVFFINNDRVEKISWTVSVLEDCCN
jgi:hypothetical protein